MNYKYATLDELKKLDAFFDSEDRWRKGGNTDNRRMCIAHAFERIVVPSNGFESERTSYARLSDTFSDAGVIPKSRFLVSWNDYHLTTFADIKAGIAKAIEFISKREQS